MNTIKRIRMLVLFLFVTSLGLFLLGNYELGLGEKVEAQEVGCTIDEDCSSEAPYEICFDEVCLKGDVNNDGSIGMGDFSAFKEDYISFVQDGWDESLKRSDFNIDERISMVDYSLFVLSYRIFNLLIN